MRRRSLLWLGLFGVAGAGPLAAQRGVVGQVQGLSTFAAVNFVGGGLGIGLWLPGSLRLTTTGNVGRRAGRVAGRTEAMLTYHLAPYRRRGLELYGGGGTAVVWSGGSGRGYVLVVLGVESRPAGGNGWFAEAGVGGGIRLAVGWRVRVGGVSRR